MGNYNKKYLLIYLVNNQNSCRSEEKKNNKVKNESFTKTVMCGIAAGGCACLLTNSEFQQQQLGGGPSRVSSTTAIYNNKTTINLNYDKRDNDRDMSALPHSTRPRTASTKRRPPVLMHDDTRGVLRGQGAT
jgi:hypothetical protein